MNEIEAKSKIKHRIGVIREIAGCSFDSKSVEDLEIAVQVLKEIREYREIGTVEELKALKMENAELHCELQSIKATMDLFEKEIREKAIDEFAEIMKERLKGMQMVELQGEDVCPCAETGEECPYINQDIGCQYCAREQTIKDIDEISEQMKGGAE